jgi:hypothetical protein
MDTNEPLRQSARLAKGLIVYMWPWTAVLDEYAFVGLLY